MSNPGTQAPPALVPAELLADVPAPDPEAGPPLRRVELFFVWGFWGFIAALTSINAAFNDLLSSGGHLPFAAPLLAAVLDAGVWAMLTPLIFRATRHYSFDRPHWLLSLGLLLAAGLVIAILETDFMRWVRYRESIYYLYRQPLLSLRAQFGPRQTLERFWFVSEFVIYLVVLAAGYAYDNFARYRQRQREALALRSQAANLRAQLATARLDALRSQLNPHFLFNTLNAVSALIDQSPRAARRMLVLLSSLLRDTLEATGSQVTVADELRVLRRYLEIMQTRFQDRLSVVESLDPAVQGAWLPTLILQPLVENAIKHGLANMEGGGRIEIVARSRGAQLLVQIIDNGSGTEVGERVRSGGGVGLTNTHARLKELYGDAYSLQLRRVEGQTIAELALPLRTGASTAAA